MDSSLTIRNKPLTNANGHPTFLLLEKNPIIAADMIDTLETCCRCYVIHATSPGEVLEKLSQTPTLAVAFLEMSFPDLDGTELHVALKHSGARIVLTQGETHEAEVQQRGWHMLVRPFSDEMVRSVLEEMQIPLM
ncbi:hypothetical protein [uncultured Roseovarius sp.]|uniref:hypothetical protein n=1 Tax=uncultured Roseovarius sp. TaxID=293344 RepID=UPI002632E5F7|nr:hypothetical protein [uncultured Roseovarius sp.]